MFKSIKSLASVAYVVLAANSFLPLCRAQTTTVLYDAGPGPAIDPTSLPQWSEGGTGGGTHELNPMPSTTTDGKPAWMFGDPLVGGGHNGSLNYDFTRLQLWDMSHFGFDLEVEMESLGDGGFISFGYTGTNFNQTGPDRSGFTPGNSGGVTETFTWSFDPLVDATVINSSGTAIANTNSAWSGNIARLNLADNSTGSDAMNFKLVKAVLTIGENTGSLNLKIDRNTGEVTLTNTFADIAFENIVGYSLLSASGSLDQSGWDKQEGGDSQLANDNDQWTALTGAGVSTDLSESVVATTGDGSGGDLAPTTTWNFGNVLRKSPFDDLVFELHVADGSEEGSILSTLSDVFRVEVIGDTTDPADLDTNGVVDLLDWMRFKENYGSDVSGLGDVEAYLDGSDINLDGLSNTDDFVAYRDLYAAATGETLTMGAIAVPEPATWMLALFSLLVIGAKSQVKRSGKLLLGLAVAAMLALPSSSQALTLDLYDADPDGNPATPAPDPTTLGWFIDNTSDFTPNTGFSTPGTTSLGAPAWRLDDAGSTGAGPNQNNRLGYALSPFIIDQMDSGGFTLTMEFEAFDAGAFVGIGYNHDGADNDVGLTGDSRYGQVPAVGMHTYTYSWDGTTATPNPGAAGPANFSTFWGGNTPGGGMIYFGDASSNSSLMNLAITKVTLDGPDLNLVEPGATVNLTTGEVKLFGDDITNLDVTSYSLTSSLGQLVAGNLTSLESQHIGDAAMDPDNGIGFEILGTPSEHEITEGDLTGTTVFDNSTSLSLGNVFDTATSELDRDLELSLTTLGGRFAGQVIYIPGTTVDGDYNGNGVVDAADYTVWRDNLGANMNLPNVNPLAATPGVVDEEDYNYWKSRFGATSGSGNLAGASVVPEPGTSALALLGIAGALMLIRRKTMVPNGALAIIRAALVVVIAGAVGGSPALAAITLERSYTLGDDDAENAQADTTVGSASSGVTFDSAGAVGAGDLQDLNVNGAPTYVSVSDRPGADGNELGSSFDGASDALDTGISMNAPVQMWKNATFFPGPPTGVIFPHNYEGIFSHGIQLWTKPDQSALGTATQTLVSDTAEHGIGIAANGNWELLFDKLRLDTGVSVASTLDEDGWAHVMEISGFSDRFGGATADDGALLVNGIAVAVRNSFYDPSATPLVVGAQPDGQGGFTNHYDGTLDDVRLFLWGDNSNQLGQDGTPGGMNTDTAANNGLNADGQDWGTLDLGTDNDWIEMELENMGVTDRGDVNLSGGMADAADVTDFLSHWRKQFVVNGVQIGDWYSRQEGDLNYDGIVDLRDARLLHNSLLAAGAGGLNFSLLGGGENVPEPSTLALTALGLLAVGACSYRGANRRRGVARDL